MPRLIVLANEATATQRRVYFHLVDEVDGKTPENGEAGGQPQVSLDGGAWTNTGIGTLVLIGNGRYYADLTQVLVQTAGTLIETRYKSANTAECPGDSVQVVAFDPYSSTNLGLSSLPTSSPGTANGLIRVGANSGHVSFDDGIAVTCVTVDRDALSLIGNGAGDGLHAQGGANFGRGAHFTSPAAEGFICIGGVNSSGAFFAGTGNGSGLYLQWGGSGSGADLQFGTPKITSDSITAPVLAASAVDKIVDAVLDELLAGHVTAGSLGKAVADILAKTGTDGVALSATICNKIADHVRRRTQASVEGSVDGDALNLLSLYGLIQMIQESLSAAGVLTVYKTDGTTVLGTRALATNPAAVPVVGVS